MAQHNGYRAYHPAFALKPPSEYPKPEAPQRPLLETSYAAAFGAYNSKLQLPDTPGYGVNTTFLGGESLLPAGTPFRKTLDYALVRKEPQPEPLDVERIIPKFVVTVSDVPPPPQGQELEEFKARYINMQYLSDHHDPNASFASDMNIVKDLQYKRVAWARGNIWTYVNVLRVTGFEDDQIQAMCDGIRPLAFAKNPSMHIEYCASLSKLKRDLESSMGWRNVRFIQTGSSCIGFSTNPVKGVPDRPTRITDPGSSDVDLVICGEGIRVWLDRLKEHRARNPHAPKVINKFEFQSNRARHVPAPGLRVGCADASQVCPALGQWYDVWSKKFGGGLQLTFDKDPLPELPPWESYIPITKGPPTGPRLYQ